MDWTLLFLLTASSLSMRVAPASGKCASDSKNPKLCRCRLEAERSLSALLKTVPKETEILYISGTIPEVRNGTFKLANLKHVATLFMDNISLQSLKDGAFDGLSELQRLSLRENKLQALSGLPKTLTNLDLSQNKFQIFPDFSDLCLKELNMNDNKLWNLEKISRLKCVESLQLSDNSLKYLNVKLEKLAYLDLSNNDISWEKSNITARNLDELILKDAGYPQDSRVVPLLGLPNLRKLDLSDSDLNRVPESLSQVSKTLQILRLSQNPLEDLSDKSFQDLPNLREIYVDYCQIHTIVNAPFQSLEQLEILDMSHNFLRAINESFLDSNVLNLNLSNSQIAAIKTGTLDRLPRLENMDLSHNLLKYVNHGAFEKIKPATINLEDNPIYCDCYIRGIRDWIQINNVNMSLSCDTPENLEMRSVTSLLDSELDCRAPTFQDNCVRTVNAYRGSDITIHFLTNGKPLPEMSYKILDGNPLPENRTKYSPTGHTIMINNVSEADSGNFTCIARNEFGTATILVTLQVFPGGPDQYKLRLAEMMILLMISVIAFFSIVWLIVFVCSKNTYFVHRPWVDDDADSSYGSIQIRR